MLNEFYVASHEITPLTLAVIAHQDETGKIKARIMEEQSEFIVDQTPTKVINYACVFFGSDLKGRQRGTREICGITHKAPICICDTSGMYFFPTSSPSKSNCTWIAHSHISRINPVENHCTEVIFKSGQRIVVEVSYGSMMNQVQRTAQYRYLLDNRINYLLSYQSQHSRQNRNSPQVDHVAEKRQKPFP